MGKKAEATQQRILEAAVCELRERGFAGFSVDSVALRSGANKALIYRYIGDRGAVISAAFGHLLQARIQIHAEQPDGLAAGLAHWIQANQGDTDFFRLLTEEAKSESPPLLGQERADYYRSQIDQLAHRLPSDDPEMTFAALLALTVFPAILPQILRLIADPQGTSDIAELQARYVAACVKLGPLAASPEEPRG
jgi:AcrR family transcriptional regulator